MSKQTGYLEAIIDVRDFIIQSIKANEGKEDVRESLFRLDREIQAQRKVRMEEYNKETIDDQAHSCTNEFSV